MSRFGELLAKLARADVRYVLVGGGAVLLHGHSRVTADLDILIEATEENARRLLEALSSWGEGAGTELMVEELTLVEPGALRVSEDFPLDIFTQMRARSLDRNLSYADVAADAERRTLSDGTVVIYASIPCLLEMKTGTGRPKDELDVKTLSEIALGTRQAQAVDLATFEPDSTAGRSGSDQGDWPLVREE